MTRKRQVPVRHLEPLFSKVGLISAHNQRRERIGATHISNTTMVTTEGSPIYRVPEIGETSRCISEQLTTLHHNVHHRPLPFLPRKPIKRFVVLHTAAQHFYQAFHALMEHPLGNPSSIWLAKRNPMPREQLEDLEQLEGHMLDVLRKSNTLLTACNTGIANDQSWMKRELQGRRNKEEEANTAKVLHEE